MNRVFAAALMVSSFLTAARAEDSDHRFDARPTATVQPANVSRRLQRYSMHLPISPNQLQQQLRRPPTALIPQLQTAARQKPRASAAQSTAATTHRADPTGPSGSSAVRQADYRPPHHMPRPIVLVDCGEACSPWTADAAAGENYGLQPIFESTLSSAFGSSHPVGTDGASSALSPASYDAVIPADVAFPPAAAYPADPIYGSPVPLAATGHDCDGPCHVCNPCSPWYRLFRPFCSSPTPDKGIGQERIFFAPFDIEVPMPNNHFAIRYDSADGLRFPDRAEYFWAKQQGPGPDAPERSIDYQDLRFILSAGNKRFSTITDIPLRFVDAAGNGATGGLGDISIATKLLLIDGNNWKITQYFRTVLQTGAVARGLSAGHVSLEPGLLAQFKWTERRYWFGELRYLFPVGADPIHSGNVLRYSVGTSSIWYETDTFAALRTLEFVGTSVLTGAKTAPDGITVLPVDGEHSLAILPGIRLVLGPAGDLGLFELGFQGGVATNKKGFYSSLARLELRFNY